MNILSRKKHEIKNLHAPRAHTWTTYLNPRNKKVSLDACAHCGVLKSMVSNESSCVDINSEISNMLAVKGWIERQVASWNQVF